MAGAESKPDDHAALLAELQHRVRNTLAAMRALVRQSAETSESLEDYVRHLDGRLDAMARVQNAVIRNPAIGIDLGMLIADELAVCDAHEGERLSIEGPRLLLHPRAAEPIGLALHELATNALKFGALASPSGRIAVYWRFEDREARAAPSVRVDRDRCPARRRDAAPGLRPQDSGGDAGAPALSAHRARLHAARRVLPDRPAADGARRARGLSERPRVAVEPAWHPTRERLSDGRHALKSHDYKVSRSSTVDPPPPLRVTWWS